MLRPGLIFIICYLSGCASLGMPSNARLAGLSPELRSEEKRAAQLINAGQGLADVHAWTAAEQKLLEASEIRKRVFGEPSLPMDEIYLRMAELHWAKHERQKTLELIDRITQDLQQERSEKSLLRAVLMMRTAGWYFILGMHRTAEQLYYNAHELCNRALGKDHIITRVSGFRLADAKHHLSEFDDKYLLTLIDDVDKVIYNRNIYRDRNINVNDLGLSSIIDSAQWELAYRWIKNEKQTHLLRDMIFSIKLQARDAIMHRESGWESTRLKLKVVDFLMLLDDHDEAYNILAALEAWMEVLSKRFENKSNGDRDDKETEYNLRNVRKFQYDILFRLAKIKINIQDYSKAEEFLRQSITACLAADGDENSENLDRRFSIMSPLIHLAKVYMLKGEHDRAIGLWSHALEFIDYRFRQNSSQENEGLLYSELIPSKNLMNNLLMNLNESHAENSKLKQLALASVLLAQNRVADEMMARSILIRDNVSNELDDAKQQLLELRMRVSALELGASDEQEAQSDQKERMLIDSRIAKLEQEIRKLTKPAGPQSELPLSRQIIDKIADQIPTGSVLVNYVYYFDKDATKPLNQQKCERHYLALLLKRDRTITAIHLGKAAPIDDLANKLRKELSSSHGDYQADSQALYKLIVSPLMPWIWNSRHLFLVPDGQLNLIPFEILQSGSDFLLDMKALSYLNSGRDLLREPILKPATDVVVFANPDLKHAPLPDAIETAAPDGASLTLRRSERLLSQPPRGLKLGVLPSLEGAEDEAHDIGSLFRNSSLNLRQHASEQRLFQLPRPPGILHMATHGFFIDETPEEPVPEARTPLVIEFSPHMREPDVRSILVLAGAALPRLDPIYDGLATALELSTLPLVGTQLVVLAACDSGRGVLLPGEGVAGLRRAFLVAGAETVVASLWKVNDDVTRQLMHGFYRRLQAGEGRAEAMRNAAHEIRDSYPHPYFWASFLVIGRDSPLRDMKSLLPVATTSSTSSTR